MVMTSHENDSQLPGSAKSADVRVQNPEKVTEINECFAEGYRLFVAKDYENAAEHLVKCNEASVALYGQFAPECFKPHYYYGLCMLEIAQSIIEDQVVPIVDAPISEDDEDADEEAGEAEPVADDNANYKPDDNEAESAAGPKADDGKEVLVSDSSPKSATTAASKPVVVEEADSPSKTPKKPAAAENASDESTACSDHFGKVESTTRDDAVPADETLKDEETEDDGEEDEEDLPAERLAWESLEVARKICEKLEAQTDSEAAKTEWTERRAEVLGACSECLMLIEQYEQALTDLTTVLELQKRLFQPHDRRIAQTYFNMGRCHRYADNFDQAAVAFQEAGRQLQSLIDYIHEQGDAATEDEKKTADELAATIVEVAAQAQDAIDSAKTRAEQLDEQRELVKDVFQRIADDTVDDITAQIRHRKAGAGPSGSGTNGGAASSSSTTEVPTNSAGAAPTTDTVDASAAAAAGTTTTDVHTGAAIEMEEPQAVGEAGDGSVAQGQQAAVKRPAGEPMEVGDGGAKKAKIVEETPKA